jgi:hypothetical protein
MGPITMGARPSIDTKIYYNNKKRDKYISIDCYADKEIKGNTRGMVFDAKFKPVGVIEIDDLDNIDLVKYS